MKHGPVAMVKFGGTCRLHRRIHHSNKNVRGYALSGRCVFKGKI
jgi:hypothetical protein